MPRKAHHSNNWGVPRPNQTGRPRQVKQYSEEFRSRLTKALRDKAKDLGLRDEFEALADLALNVDKHQSAVIAAAWKIITDVLVVRESRHTVARTPTGPQIYLPEKKPYDDPAIYLPEEEPEEPDPPQEDINTPAPRRGMKY